LTGDEEPTGPVAACVERTRENIMSEQVEVADLRRGREDSLPKRMATLVRQVSTVRMPCACGCGRRAARILTRASGIVVVCPECAARAR
jgi:hypothetical protein